MTARPLPRTAARLLAVVTGGVLLLGAATLPAQAGNDHPRPVGGYVALGDSFASGEGLPPYATDDSCDRSTSQSYPALLETYGPRRFDRLTSAACAGARTGTVVDTQIPTLNARTRTVTLTVGGNDVGFATVIAACVYSPVPEIQATLPGGQKCRVALDASVESAIAYLGGPADPTDAGQGVRVPLVSVIGDVSAAAPRAEILVTGYPQLFGDPSADCQVTPAAPLFVGAANVAWIREKTTELNAAIKKSVRRARSLGAQVRYVDVTRAFDGHGLCDEDSPWIRGLVPTSATNPTPSRASFHPTAEGQAAYGISVAVSSLRRR